MRDTSAKIGIVVPCFNEADRLKPLEFKAFADRCHFLFVDDGSSDRTFDLVQRALVPPCEVLRLDVNRGKGEAVRTGVLHLARSPEALNFEWIGFWDADLATPLGEIYEFIRFAETVYQGEADAVVGCRLKRLGARIARDSKRHYLGRLFATIAGVITGLHAYDSQCGAKLFRHSCAEEIFREPFVSRWIFDLEILLRMRRAGLRAVECPVKEWQDRAGSHLNIVRNLFRVLRDLAQIRARYRD
jgi:glycosyltransferase involved in cell wall biosynthesis